MEVHLYDSTRTTYNGVVKTYNRQHKKTSKWDCMYITYLYYSSVSLYQISFWDVSYQQLTAIDDDFVLDPLCCCSPSVPSYPCSYFEAAHEVERGYLQNRWERRESPPCIEIIQTWTRKKCVKHKLNYKRREGTSPDIDRIWTIIEWLPYEVWCDSPQVGAPSSSWRKLRSSWSLDLNSFVRWWRSLVNRSEII